MLFLQVLPCGQNLPFIGAQWTGSWVKRKFRLRRSSDFKRVRQTGKTFTHPFLVLTLLPNPNGGIRIGIAASKAVGSAVDRNRAKRRLRAVMDEFLPVLPSGWDLVLIARKSVLTAPYVELRKAVLNVLARASLMVAAENELND